MLWEWQVPNPTPTTTTHSPPQWARNGLGSASLSTFPSPPSCLYFYVSLIFQRRVFSVTPPPTVWDDASRRLMPAPFGHPRLALAHEIRAAFARTSPPAPVSATPTVPLPTHARRRRRPIDNGVPLPTPPAPAFTSTTRRCRQRHPAAATSLPRVDVDDGARCPRSRRGRHPRRRRRPLARFHSDDEAPLPTHAAHAPLACVRSEDAAPSLASTSTTPPSSLAFTPTTPPPAPALASTRPRRCPCPLPTPRLLASTSTTPRSPPRLRSHRRRRLADVYVDDAAPSPAFTATTPRRCSRPRARRRRRVHVPLRSPPSPASMSTSRRRPHPAALAPLGRVHVDDGRLRLRARRASPSSRTPVLRTPGSGYPLLAGPSRALYAAFALFALLVVHPRSVHPGSVYGPPPRSPSLARPCARHPALAGLPPRSPSRSPSSLRLYLRARAPYLVAFTSALALVTPRTPSSSHRPARALLTLPPLPPASRSSARLRLWLLAPPPLPPRSRSLPPRSVCHAASALAPIATSGLCTPSTAVFTGTRALTYLPTILTDLLG
ncbi:hypothetical protein B0H13DRAFT_2573605 [Mycena leptocephala]|nr:hypothetical protein B0H13DRAFT_2573605 [Mycena leptocephala]